MNHRHTETHSVNWRSKELKDKHFTLRELWREYDINILIYSIIPSLRILSRPFVILNVCSSEHLNDLLPLEW